MLNFSNQLKIDFYFIIINYFIKLIIYTKNVKIC